MSALIDPRHLPEGYITPRERARLIWEIGKLAWQADEFWIFCHENPDGDTLGCGLAVYAAVVAMNRKALFFSPSPLPRMYRYLPYADKVICGQDLPETTPSMVLVNDNASFERLGEAYVQQLTEKGIGPLAKHKSPDCAVVNIDHHLSNERYGDINIVDPRCGCCGELVYYAFKQLRVPFTTEVVFNLYATVLTDTGRFSYGNTSYESFQMASELIQLGADPFEVVSRVYNTRSVEQIRLLSNVLATMTLEPALGYFYCQVSMKMLEETNTILSDSEGVLDVMKTVADFDTCFLLKEEPGGHIRVSARSNGKFDVNEFAARFGGGGHPAASGFVMQEPLEHAPQALAAEMRAHREELRRTRGPQGRRTVE